MKILFSVLGVLFAIVILIVLTFVLFVSRFKPSDISINNWVRNKQVDLGVSSSLQDYEKVISDIGFKVTTNDCSTNCAPKYSDIVNIDRSITNSQASALINEWGNNSRNAPFYNTQVRVNNDGSVDFSSMVSTSKVGNLLTLSSDISKENKQVIQEYIGKLGSSFPVYAHGILSIKDNEVDLNLTSLKTGLLPIPISIISDYKNEVNSYIENRIRYVSNLNIKTLEFKDGNTHFVGTMPKEIQYYK